MTPSPATAVRQSLLVAMLLCIGRAPAVAQSVAIAPQMIVVDASTNASAITLVNQGDSPAEVSLSTEYGYPATDSAGAMFLQTFPTVDDTTPSAAPWIQIFPERLHLAPHARRTVRLLVTPPAAHPLPQREYWARLIVAARAAAPPHTIPGDTGAIQVGLSLEVRSILPIFYRKGHPATGVLIDSARTAVHADSLVARARLTRTGTGAFIGSLTATLQDAHGTAVAQGVLPLGVYYTLTPRVPMSLHGVRPGTYTLVLDAVGTRPDVSPELLLHAASVQTTLPVTIQ